MQIVIALFDRFTALDAVGPFQVLHHLPGLRLARHGEAGDRRLAPGDKPLRSARLAAAAQRAG